MMWLKVSKDEFFETFNVKNAKVLSSYTNTTDDYAETKFSMNEYDETHKTIHERGLFKDPDYFVNRSLTTNQLKGIE